MKTPSRPPLSNPRHEKFAQAIAREVWKSVRADEMPALIEQLLVVYLRERSEGESFIQFTNRFSAEQLIELCDPLKINAA